MYKLGRLPDGDLVATTATSGLVRIAPSGSISTVVPGLRAYGLAVHPSGAVFAATNYTAGTDGIVRIDPATGDWELVEPLPATPRDIAFGPGFGTLYIGTTDGGAVLALRLDAQGEPTGPAAHLLDVPAAWHDTVEVDACGNLYVGSVFSTSIFRVRAADGSVQEVLDWPPGFNGPYGHGLQWGEGPWSDRSIFVAHPYVGSRVTEWAIGVPGARWPGTALGAAEL
ncbi:MAG: hypothetical protein D6798_03330 [Deltaproteobacteria bacterium]|nr:MAG: hypothetical protein D6798_03330 [Deltaproteobacteria bacterium]